MIGPALVSPPAFDYADFGARFGLDIAALAAGMWMVQRRHGGRRDLMSVVACFNIGLFVVLTAIASAASATAIGFGLFAMLSIIRLRSEPFSNTELGVFFAGLVLALVNGVEGIELALAVLLNAIVLGALALSDHPLLGQVPKSRDITLDCIHDNDATLRADVEHRLGVRVVDFTVLECDYVREVTRLTIRYVGEPGGVSMPVGA
jgi:lysylphosphatidylglycerol synthetase-like protein (DUF2156 family)